LILRKDARRILKFFKVRAAKRFERILPPDFLFDIFAEIM